MPGTQQYCQKAEGLRDKTASFRPENWRFWSGLRDLNPRSLGPKPSAIPNFAKPGYEVKNFSDVVKHVVKGYFRPEQGRSQEEKVPAPQRVFGLVDFTGANRAPAPKSSALPTGPHPDMKLRESSRSGQTCGQRLILTKAREKSRRKSASVAMGFRVSGMLPPIWCSSTQTRRPTNWATPGYEIERAFQKWSNKWSTTILDQSGGEVKKKNF